MLKKIRRLLSKEKQRYMSPNRFARLSSYKATAIGFIVDGYQAYKYKMKGNLLVPVGINTTNKYNILNYFIRSNIKDKSFVDIGSNNGFFVFLAALYEAKKAMGVDIDEKYLLTSKKVNKYFGFKNVEFANINFEEIKESFDFTMFLSMLHWVYTKTSFFGSLDSIIKSLSDITDECLIIEWVDPADHKILKHKHLSYEESIKKDEYSFDNFDKALNKYFKKYYLLGINTPTRYIYVAWK